MEKRMNRLGRGAQRERGRFRLHFEESKAPGQRRVSGCQGLRVEWSSATKGQHEEIILGMKEFVLCPDYGGDVSIHLSKLKTIRKNSELSKRKLKTTGGPAERRQRCQEVTDSLSYIRSSLKSRGGALGERFQRRDSEVPGIM